MPRNIRFRPSNSGMRSATRTRRFAKDLAYFGQFGHPGIGYRVEELISQLRKILGTDKVWNVLLIGAGNLGRALIAYRGFLAKGSGWRPFLMPTNARWDRRLGI